MPNRPTSVLSRISLATSGKVVQGMFRFAIRKVTRHHQIPAI
jgi:hypothetical protein